VFTFFIVLHVFICIGLMIVVLMQSAKGEGLAGAFGGGGALSGAVFGGRGAATFLSRATTVLAVLFMVSCISLTFISKGRSAGSAVAGSAVQRTVQEQMENAPAQQQQPVETQPGTEQGGTPFDEGGAAPQGGGEQQQAGGEQPTSGGEQQEQQPTGGGGQ